MPPFVARKRRLSTPPSEAPTPKRAKKPTLFDTVDQEKPTASISENLKFLEDLDNGNSESSLSDADSSDFEDALPQTPRKVPHHAEEDEKADWEDAMQPEIMAPITPAPDPSGDLELTISNTHRNQSLTNPSDKKKGPSKIERQIRTATHCMHVQFLLFHNLIRNAWICDKEVQRILVRQLPDSIKKEVETWKIASGAVSGVKDAMPSGTQPKALKGKGADRGRGRGKSGKGRDDVRSQREWGEPAQRQERGMPNLSHGDPVIRLLRNLAAYWKQRFRIVAPGLRKQGYKSLAVLEQEVASFHNGRHDVEEHGEKIDDLNAFKQCARKSESSRDVGAQLFTALIRGLGVEARLVASLQPVGFGWSKSEEASVKKKKKKEGTEYNALSAAGNIVDDSETDASGATLSTRGNDKSRRVELGAVKSTNTKSKTKHSHGGPNTPIDLLEDSELSSAASSKSHEDDDSVVDITTSMPERKPNMSYDKDIPFPNYWTEVISPLTHKVYPVDSLILIPPVATKQEHLAAFEPRGAKAEKAKQVLAYVIAYSADGTAKDVTTRYLKRHMWPGKTKGVRMPIEKLPVLNKHGKVRHYEEYDWFKTVMSGYERSGRMRTAVDDLEEEKDLKAVKPEKKQAKEGEETLQGYKQSADFVLERHLRREEAILPGSEPVKMFVAGKGDKAKKEPVYRRNDVVACRTGESWHKEGRQVKAGEYPMKMVPIRAVTLIRKREVEEAERDGGEKMKQGLYALDQTEWIILPPIQDGVIPKNAFGNMDCYVPTMVPKGAVHIPLRGTLKICKRLGIDFAEAVTGFEFGNQRAVPVITGVVVASEYEHAVIDEWEKDEEERKIKKEGKREKAALSMWRKFLMGLRIIERVREEYGDDDYAHVKEELNPFTNKNRRPEVPESDSLNVNGHEASLDNHNEDLDGGFLPEDEDEDQARKLLQEPAAPDNMGVQQSGGFFLEDDPANAIISARQHRVKGSPEFHFASITGDKKMGSDESNDEEVSPMPAKSKVRKNDSNGTRPGKGVQGSASKAQLTKASAPKPTTGRSRQRKISGPNTDTKPSSVEVATNASIRAAPKRNAARKSETALKSHYFVGTDTEEEHHDSLTSENDDVYKVATNKSKAPKAVDAQTPKRKRGRPRKTL
ncbi:hypothetical protein MMC13_008496 [Lambiella insularis]|nr:hypothetical protein [Lambiella insularis]